MRALGFPMGNGKTDTLLTKGEKPEWGSAKGNRDAMIAKRYRVLLMLGDNFGDFTDKASGNLKQREAAYREYMSHWEPTGLYCQTRLTALLKVRHLVAIITSHQRSVVRRKLMC